MSTNAFPIGRPLPAVKFVVTQEHMSVFSDMEHSNTAGPGGRLQLAPKNIHNNLAFAKQEGLDGMIADGMIVTLRIERQLRELFGTGFVKGGRIMTKFVKPVYADDCLDIQMTVNKVVPEAEKSRVHLDITCTNQRGTLVTTATASALTEIVV